MRAEGFGVHNEDVARLSLIGYEHINMLGRYAFTLPEPAARGRLRPLRYPAVPGGEEARIEVSVPLRCYSDPIISATSSLSVLSAKSHSSMISARSAVVASMR